MPAGNVGHVRSVIIVIVVASIAYLGTMFDDFFAFTEQLKVTEQPRHRRVGWSQFLGVLTLVLIAGAVGSLLAPIPTRLIGLLFVVPWALAAYAWRQRHQPRREQFRRGVATTFLMTLALGGDNLAVWIPLVRAKGTLAGLGTAAVLLLWEIPFLLAARGLSTRPRLVTWGARYGRQLVPFVYLGLGVLILMECGTLG